MAQEPGAARREEFRIDGSDLMDRARQLINEGNRRRLVVRDEDGKDVFDLPLTIAVVGGILVLPATAVGIIAALATRHSIVVESIGQPGGTSSGAPAPPPGDVGGTSSGAPALTPGEVGGTPE